MSVGHERVCVRNWKVPVLCAIGAEAGAESCIFLCRLTVRPPDVFVRVVVKKLLVLLRVAHDGEDGRRHNVLHECNQVSKKAARAALLRLDDRCPWRTVVLGLMAFQAAEMDTAISRN